MNRNAVTCPPCGENVGLPTKRGAYKGFTLIELLVVVLIIGILSAVAVPQYTKAVEKSRTREAVLMLKNMQKAWELCRLQYGNYVEECGMGENGLFSRMDIEIPGMLVEEGCDSGDKCYLTKDWLYDYDEAVLYAFRVTDPENLLDGPYSLELDLGDGGLVCHGGDGCKNVCGHSGGCNVQL